MVLKLSKRGTTFTIEISSDSDSNGSRIKIQRILYELKTRKNSLDKLGTLEFDKIWLTSSLLHLIAKENEFPAKEDQKFKFLLKLEFGLLSQ
jgi:hypothetical protein